MEDTRWAVIVDAARAYAARAWSVIPMQAHGKRPLVPWRAFQQRIAGEGEIARWFARWPDANVGIVTGRISGIVVVDVDLRHGGPASVAEAEARLGPLQVTVESATGGGGRHLYYAHPGAPMANRVALLPGVDLRADGGCVVAPPSVHPNGKRYTWVAGRGPGEVSLAVLPAHFGGAGARIDTTASRLGHLRRSGVDVDAVNRS